MRLKMQYTNNTLFVVMQGNAFKDQIQIVQKRLFSILQFYGISNIVVDIEDMERIDKEAFYHFLDEYDKRYGGHLEVYE